MTNHASAFWDWLPTACELAGVEVPGKTDGISFVPLLKGEEQKKHEYLFWRWSKFRAVRMGKWKGVATDGKLALYDLEKDLGEERDVAGENGEVVKKMEGVIAELE